MAVIKLNSGGQVILRGGLPSCTCCGTILYVYYREFPTPYTSYLDAILTLLTMTGTVGAGFTGTGPNGQLTLVYDLGISEWVMTDYVYGASKTSFGVSPTNPANPTGNYHDADFWESPDYFGRYIAMVSLTPFPP